MKYFSLLSWPVLLMFSCRYLPPLHCNFVLNLWSPSPFKNREVHELLATVWLRRAWVGHSSPACLSVGSQGLNVGVGAPLPTGCLSAGKVRGCFLCETIQPDGRTEKPSHRQRQGFGPQHHRRPSAGKPGCLSSAWVVSTSYHSKGGKTLGKEGELPAACHFSVLEGFLVSSSALAEGESDKFFWRATSLCLNKRLLWALYDVWDDCLPFICLNYSRTDFWHGFFCFKIPNHLNSLSEILHVFDFQRCFSFGSRCSLLAL